MLVRMKLSPLLGLPCLVVLLCGSATAQGETSAFKKAKAAFENADRALNEAWAAIKQSLSESEVNRLRENQRSWLEYRDHLASSTT